MTHSEEQHTIPELALDWHRAGRGAALATVIETWGSAPRRVGAQLVVDQGGAMAGSVSGGCVEGAVVAAACDALRDGGHRVLDFGVADEDAFAVGLACGGRIRILVQPVGGALGEGALADLVAARAARQPIAMTTDLTTGAVTITRDGLMHAQSALIPTPSGAEQFTAVHQPPLRMVIIGAVHIAQALIPMARACGHDPVVIDPRSAFASVERFPDVPLLEDWPDEALRAVAPDRATSVITLTHDPKLDDPALQVALRSDAYYIGCLGSTRTHAKRVARLREAGFDEAALARLHAPVGLSIGAAGPAEIAVSIMAQVIATQRGA